MAGRRGLELYLDLLSQPCRAIHIFVNVNKIPHTVKTVALRKGEHKTPDFAKRNPMQKVPVIDDNGFVLTESDAILKYLATKYHVPDHWYPKQPERRAKVDEYTAWHHTNTRPQAAKVFLLEVLLPRMSGQPSDQAKVERAVSELSVTLDKLQDMFLKRQPFLCGDDISLADLLAVCELMQVGGYDIIELPGHGSSRGGRDVLQDRPALQRWLGRVQSAVGCSFDEAHAVLYRLRDNAKAKL